MTARRSSCARRGAPSATYEWGHHVPLGREAGLTDDEMLALADRGEVASADDALLVRAVDELFDDYCIGQETWNALARALRRDAA